MEIKMSGEPIEGIKNLEIKPSCIHEKVFASFSYMSIPPKTPWICKKCGEKGMDSRRYVNQEEYEKLTKEKPSLKG